MDSGYPHSDQLELLVDGYFDRKAFGRLIINTRSETNGTWRRRSVGDEPWNPDIERATFIGEDFWSLECRITFGQKGFPPVQSGDVWGFNIVRLFRGTENSLWLMLTSRRRMWSGDQFGLLVFN